VNKIEELLRAKRQIQIAELEGREPEKSHEEVDTEIDEEVRRQKKQRHRKRRRRPRMKRKGLFITQHAWKRMGQRRMTIKHVYALWIYGEARTLHDTSRTVHVCTEAVYREMPARERDLLSSFIGCAIIVQAPPEDEPEKLPVVVTVIADGEDTHFG
jgi:hypothetical protein